MKTNLKQRIEMIFPPLGTPHARMAALFPHPAAWALLAAAFLAVLALMALSGFSIRVQRADVQVLGCLLLMAIVAWRAYSQGLLRSSILLQFLLLLSLMAYMGGMLSYTLMSLRFPPMDQALARLDALMGFDWIAHVRFVNAHPALVKALGFAYNSINYFILGIPLWLLATGRIARMRGYFLLSILTGLLTITLGGMLPALGGYGHYQPAAEMTGNLPPQAGRYFLAHVSALMNGQMSSVALGEMKGIICIPSFHTILALIFIWSFRNTRLFWPAFAFNITIIVSTISMGGHYLTDLMAGSALFLAVLWSLEKFGWLDESADAQSWAQKSGLSAPLAKAPA